MARRISVGRVGDPVLGVMSVTDTTLSPVNANASITLSPTGTGQVETTTDINLLNEKALKLYESGSTNYVALKSPSSVTANVTYTLPGGGENNGYVLATDGSGTLSWAAITISLADSTTPSSPYSIPFASATDTNVSSLTTSSARLNFTPNTGTLFATILSSDTGNITAVNCTSLTASGALSAASITETSSIALKENLNPITDALDKVLSLNAFTYDRKNGSSFNEAGLIAEEVNEIIPNIVEKDENGNPASIQYSRLVAYLIESVKELKSELDSIKR